MEQRKFRKQIERLTTEQLKVKKVVESHQEYMQERQTRLDQLAKEFTACRTGLQVLEPTPENLLQLWKKSEFFKEELLELSELMNEYFRRSNKRRFRAGDALQRLEQLTTQKVLPSKPSKQVFPSNEDALISNPFHY